jgi:hypothetical protein
VILRGVPGYIGRQSFNDPTHRRSSLMTGLQLPRSRFARRPFRPYGYVSLLVALALLVVPAVAAAATGFTEQVASARWSTPFECPNGSTAPDGRLIVETDNFIEAGTTPDPNPPLRVGFTGQCPDGTYSWGFTQAAPTQFAPNLNMVSVSGTFTGVRDNRGGTHTVSVDARWKGTGPVRTTVNGPGSKRKERSATARATIVFDGNTLVDGVANFPFPEPFIRVRSPSRSI